MVCAHLSFLKAELTQSLQQLSEKAKSATEVIQRLKSSSENVQVNQFLLRFLFEKKLYNDFL